MIDLTYYDWQLTVWSERQKNGGDKNTTDAWMSWCKPWTAFIGSVLLSCCGINALMFVDLECIWKQISHYFGPVPSDLITRPKLFGHELPGESMNPECYRLCWVSRMIYYWIHHHCDIAQHRWMGLFFFSHWNDPFCDITVIIGWSVAGHMQETMMIDDMMKTLYKVSP